jgi:peptidyl-prolyl cis-trans isomerase A (cyclophilin A)
MNKYFVRSWLILCLLPLITVFAASAVKADLTELVFDTDAGSFVVEVYADRAPASSASFLAYVDQGLYEGAAFYRTVRKDNDKGSPVIEVVQGGLLDEGRELPPVPHESSLFTGLLHTDATISLARAEPGTGGGAAFFICIGDQPGLDYGAIRNPDGLGFAVFGKVIEGMDVIRAIHKMDANGDSESDYTKGQMLTETVIISRASRR